MRVIPPKGGRDLSHAFSTHGFLFFTTDEHGQEKTEFQTGNESGK
jgi:hypothetical protein